MWGTCGTACREHLAGPASESGTCGGGKGGQDLGKGCQAERGTVLVLGACVNVRVLVNLESVVCVLHQ